MGERSERDRTASRREKSPAGLSYGMERSSTPLTIEKMAVLAPIPKASVASATAVKTAIAAMTRAAVAQIAAQRFEPRELP